MAKKSKISAISGASGYRLLAYGIRRKAEGLIFRASSCMLQASGYRLQVTGYYLPGGFPNLFIDLLFPNVQNYVYKVIQEKSAHLDSSL